MSVVPRLLDAADQGVLASVHELLSAAEQADGTPPVSDQALLAATLGSRALYAYDSDASGQAAAAQGPLAVAVLGAGELDLVVRPEARGRGVGTSALRHLLSTVDREASPEVRAWAHGENPAARSLLGAAGFTPARTLFRLALDPARLPEAIARARALPPGFRMETYSPARADHATEWVRVNAAAFADHPEQGAVTLRDFEALTREAWFDPEDLMLAFDVAANSLAGYAWVKTVRAQRGTETETETELYVLGVDPAYAGRGLGAGLFGETLRRMATHAPDRITLYVDGTNETARAIYDRAGFTVDAVSTQWVLNNR